MKNKRYTVQQYADLYGTNKMKVHRLLKEGLLKKDPIEKGVLMIPDSERNRKVIMM